MLSIIHSHHFLSLFVLSHPPPRTLKRFYQKTFLELGDSFTYQVYCYIQIIENPLKHTQKFSSIGTAI